MQVTARNSHAACQSFLTVRRLGQCGNAPLHRAFVDVRAHHPIKVKGRAGISIVVRSHTQLRFIV